MRSAEDAAIPTKIPDIRLIFHSWGRCKLAAAATTSSQKFFPQKLTSSVVFFGALSAPLDRTCANTGEVGGYKIDENNIN